MSNYKTVPIFFSSDENYIPFLSVAIRSLIDNSSEENDYSIYILNDGLSERAVNSIGNMQTKNVHIIFIDVNERLKSLCGALNLRDYYTISIYFRLFIASMFPDYHKAIYMDCDLVILDDVRNLYDIDLQDKLLGVISDKVVSGYRVLHSYTDEVLGLDYRNYFNSGVMLMNLDKLREEHIEKKFVEILNKYDFKTIAPDQDYLNFLCSGKVMYLDTSWNVMWSKKKFRGEPKIIHYNMFKKPWIYSKMRFGKYFWKYAENTPYFDDISKMKKRFLFRQKLCDRVCLSKLLKKSREIALSDDTFCKVLTNAKKQEV